MLDLADVQARFGTADLPHNLIDAFPHALRFELGGAETATVPRFLRALDRARSLAGRTFRGSRQLWALFDFYGSKRPGTRGSKALGALAEAGFGSNRLLHLGHFRQEPDEPEDAALYRHWYGAEIDPSDFDVLLWCAAAREMPITPRGPAFGIYVVDAARGLIFHVYDDRGVDVVATSAEDLRSLTSEFPQWLLAVGQRP